jgi:putative ABC transport system permease protein
MSTAKVFALSLSLALLINGLVAVGGAVAALDVAQPHAQTTDLVVSARSLRPADLAALTRRVGGEASISPLVVRSEPVDIAGRQTNVTVEGVQPGFAHLEAWHIQEGGFFSSQDETSLNAVAVVSRGLAPDASLQDVVVIRGVPFTIVGFGSADSGQNVVLIPLRTAQIRLFGATALDQIVLQVGSTTEAASVGQQVEALLRSRHSLAPGQANDFTIADVARGESASDAISATRVLQAIQQFACSAKYICAPAPS